jgi:hypothetical protein
MYILARLQQTDALLWAFEKLDIPRLGGGADFKVLMLINSSRR